MGNTLELECIECKTRKPVDDFWVDNSRNSRSRGNRNSRCKSCITARRTRYEILPDDHPDMVANKRQCSICKETKPLSNFITSSFTPMGRGYRCRPCIRGEKTVRKGRIGSNSPKVTINVQFKRGVSTATFELLFKSQGGHCAICDKKMDFYARDTVVDHDHITGLIRGVLCMKCNLGLGHLNDSIDLLVSASNYLRKHAAIGPSDEDGDKNG